MTEFVLPPSLIANEADWTLIDFSGVQQSPLSGAMRTISRGQRWQAFLQFHDLLGDNRNSLNAIIAAVRGKSNRIWLADPGYRQAGSFPAPEMLSNSTFLKGTTGWTANGTATILGYNRTMTLTTTGATLPGLYQSVPLVIGQAYALRACFVDGPTSSALVLGPQLSDASNQYGNRSLARGLITVAAVAQANGAANQYPLLASSGGSSGQIVMMTYASLRRCALAMNPSGLTYYTTIPCDALPVNTPGLLRAGDRVEINGELKTVTFDLNSDTNGIGQLMFEPALRKLCPDNAPIIIGEPMMRGIMSTDGLQVTRAGAFSDYSLTFVEA